MATKKIGRAKNSKADALLIAAMNFACAGLPVFPCKLDKTPYTARGFKDASSDANLVTEFWEHFPGAGIGMATGTVSGRIVIDVDPRHGGEKSIEELEAKYGALPPTLESKTGGGGRHLFFQARGLDIRNSAGVLGDGLDVRANGGYIILPPSPHPSGRSYEWLNGGNQPVLDMPQWLEKLLIRREPPKSSPNGNGEKIPQGGRNQYLTSLAGALRRKGATLEAIEAALLAENARCDPPLPEKEIGVIAKSVARYEPEQPQNKIGSSREDTSNAERFASQHQELARFWHGRDVWALWAGTHWPDDNERQVVELAKKTARSIYAEAAALSDDEAKRMGRWAERSLNRDKITAMLDLAKSDPRIRVTTDKLDVDPWLLNFTNGTVDLRTGKLREHRREDYITKLVRCPYTPDLVAPRWNLFLKQTFGDSADWVQKAVGYSFTGVTTEKAVFLMLGQTDAGKTTFLTVLREIFADYSKLLQIETLMVSKHEDNNTSADMAELRGARFVTTSETEECQRLRESKLKRISQGMADITSTRKYENPITFPETHKLWIDANFEPTIRGVDDAIWNRLLPIPCEHRVEDGEKDKELKNKLLRESEAIASWVVAGAVRWHEEGLGRHELIEQRRSGWRAGMDIVGEFLEECCIEDKRDLEKHVGASEMYLAFSKWAKERKGIEHPINQTVFGRRMDDRRFQKAKDPNSRRIIYRGISLRTLF